MDDSAEHEKARDSMPVEYVGLSIRQSGPQVILDIDGMSRDVPVSVILEVAEYIKTYHPHLINFAPIPS